MPDDIDSITNLLRAYQDALNRSDTDAVMSLYAPDGVFMPQHSPSSIGVEAIRQAYETIFRTIGLSVAFRIEEIHVVSEAFAFARTNSAGTVTPAAGGAAGAEANQELFVLQKRESAWMIARYCFSTTNPPRA